MSKHLRALLWYIRTRTDGIEADIELVNQRNFDVSSAMVVMFDLAVIRTLKMHFYFVQMFTSP